MANTERMMALTIVNEAYDAVVDAQFVAGRTEEQRRVLEEAELLLYKLNNRIVHDINASYISNLRSSAGELNAIVAQMKEDVRGLQRVARNVGRAAEAAGLLASAIETSGRMAAL